MSTKAASAKRRARNKARGSERAYSRVRARPVIPGTRLKITRRCLEQRMFLAPGPDPEEMENFFGYLLGVALERYNMQFHAGCQMGNHYHVDVTDVDGERVGFKTSFHGNLARGLNARRGRFDTFWEAGGSCDTCQPTDDESVEDLAYTEANPVEAGLVRWARRWPGFTSHGWKFGETRTYKRPSWYVDPDNVENPEEVHITRVRPDILPELSDEELYEHLMEQVRRRELAKQAEVKKANRRFKGERKLAKERWDSVPKTPQDRFKIRPKIVASSRWKRLAQLQRDRKWEREYATALEALRNGERPVFPYGTYLLHVRYGIPRAEAPP